MDFDQAKELVRKLYDELTLGITPKPEDVRELGEFMSGEKLRVVFLGEYEVQYDPKSKELQVSYYPGPDMPERPEVRQGDLFKKVEGKKNP